MQSGTKLPRAQKKGALDRRGFGTDGQSLWLPKPSVLWTHWGGVGGWVVQWKVNDLIQKVNGSDGQIISQPHLTILCVVPEQGGWGLYMKKRSLIIFNQWRFIINLEPPPTPPHTHIISPLPQLWPIVIKTLAPPFTLYSIFLSHCSG